MHILYNRGMRNDRGTSRRARLPRALRRGLRDAYDHLGYVVVVTFIAFLCTVLLSGAAGLLWKSAGGSLGIVGAVLLLPAALGAYLCAVGVFYYANKAVFFEHPSAADTWKGIRLLLGPATALFAVDFLIGVVVVGDTLFFGRMFGESRNPVCAVIGILCFYVTLAWLMMALYHLPLLAAQLKMESGTKPGVILRKSYLLAADNPGFTACLFIVIIALAVLCVLPGLIGMAVLFLGAAAFLLTHALRELFIKYEMIEDEPETVEDSGWALPDAWRKRDRGNEAER